MNLLLCLTHYKFDSFKLGKVYNVFTVNKLNP